MNLFVKFFCLIFVCTPHLYADLSLKKRIQLEKQRIEKRYESFYQHQKDKKRQMRQRRAGIDEMKARRAKERRAYERARKQYVKKQKNKNNTALREKLEKQYQEKLQREKAKYNQNREEYVKLQKALQELKSKTRRVSLEAQLGLGD
ncbi:MAG: hypothetical protein MK008_09680 [Bdellovibrionales bacterium]|nr:hypothetical protein [Bdellovibrionales bacterium]